MARSTNFAGLIDILDKAAGHSISQRQALKETCSILERLRDIQNELQKEEPDPERIADLLVPVFVP